MKISGATLSVQSKSLSTGDRNGEETQNAKVKSGGQRYVTVRDGDYLYTYIVIGDNFRVLIGRLAVDKNKDEKDEKTDAVKKQDNDKQTKEALDKLKFQSMPNQLLMEYQQLQVMTLSKHDLQKKTQDTDESAANF